MSTVEEAEHPAADRFYLLLALFDSGNSHYIADLIRAAREGWEHEAMGEDDPWGEFDALWNRFPDPGQERLKLARQYCALLGAK